VTSPQRPSLFRRTHGLERYRRPVPRPFGVLNALLFDRRGLASVLPTRALSANPSHNLNSLANRHSAVSRAYLNSERHYVLRRSTSSVMSTWTIITSCFAGVFDAHVAAGGSDRGRRWSTEALVFRDATGQRQSFRYAKKTNSPLTELKRCDIVPVGPAHGGS
jgi:hypothetical protein